MAEQNGNGYRIAFWVMTVITTVFMLSIVNAVIANDKESRVRDDEIKSCINDYIIPMKESIARIEAKLENDP